ncbi:MAG: rhomboid family intramembrane serine protease [Deltaproteobacteria bacterium]|nr:rhomboid family intramembrane serine protease [Deltaproteobacteria bacterium]MBW2362572.1 rhomboid family intramembrane serine protease [Deltaproteobacteria bacterium]
MGGAGRDREAVERPVPWVGFSLACLCVLGFAYARIQASAIDAAADSQLIVAADYFRAHPYLAVPSVLAGRIDASTAQHLRQQHEVNQQRLGASPHLPQLVMREQVELDRLAQQVALKLEGRPEKRFGMIATERNPVTFVSHLFLHAGSAHLALGMLLLIAFGCSLEAAWGSVITLCGVSAAVLGSVGVFLLKQPELAQPLIGTSGLVAGFVGASAVRLVGSRGSRGLWPLLILALVALWLPPWLGAEWSIARDLGAAPPLRGGWNPSMWALVGGLGSGAGFALAVWLLGLERLSAWEDVEMQPRRGGHVAEVERALQKRSAGAQAPRLAGESGSTGGEPSVARAAVELDPATAAKAAWQALGSMDIDPETRRVLEELLAPLVAGASDPAVAQEIEPERGARVRPAQSATSNFDEETEPAGIEVPAFDRELELVSAVPLGLDETGLLIAAGQARKRVCCDRISAIAVAVVEELADRPVIVIDLVLNWKSPLEEPLKVIRLRTDAFDPRSLVEGESDPLAAVRALGASLLQKTGATPLPDEDSIRGEPFAAFKSLQEYQRHVLLIASDD